MEKVGLNIVLALVAAGCATAPVKKEVVWPPPPDVARIRFVRAFRHTEDLDTSGWARFKRGLLGGSTSPSLVQPMGLALSEDGQRLYIADYALSHVMVADLQAGTLDPFAPDEAMGKVFNVAVDAEENVYVSDSTSRVVRVFSKQGELLRAIGAGDLERPTGVAVDLVRRLLYVSDSASRASDKHRVLVFDLAGKHLRDLGHKGGADGQFYFPTYVAVDKEGNVHVADSMNFRIQVFGPDGKFLRKFGENGDGPGHFSRLKGLAFDGLGNLYAVDGGHSNVQIFNRDFVALTFFGGYASRLEYFDIPSGIAIDPKTNLIYVCNEYVARINVYQLINTSAEDLVPEPAGSEAHPANVEHR